MAGFDPAVFIENLSWMKPELLLAGFGLLLLLASATVPATIRQIGGWLTLAVLAVAAFLVTAQLSAGSGGTAAAVGAFPDIAGNPAFVVDGFSSVFKLIFLLGAAFTVLMSMKYPDTDGEDSAEFLALVVFSVFGMMFLASGTGLITIYIGLETMALAGYLLVGIGFKVAAVPFHMWAPDAYEGATTPATSFLATAAKAGAFAMLLRVFVTAFGERGADWAPLMILLAAASMTVGNIAALRQDNVKRMLAFSSVGHAGYVLMGLIAVGLSGGDAAIRARGLVSVALYLFVYTFATAGAFALVALLRKNGQPGEMLDDFNGLVKRHPVASVGMLLFLLSLAGIPCTAGFIGKWWLFGAAIRVNLIWLPFIRLARYAVLMMGV